MIHGLRNAPDAPGIALGPFDGKQRPASATAVADELLIWAQIFYSARKWEQQWDSDIKARLFISHDLDLVRRRIKSCPKSELSESGVSCGVSSFYGTVHFDASNCRSQYSQLLS